MVRTFSRVGSSPRGRFADFVRTSSPAVAGFLRRRLFPLPAADLDDLMSEVFLVAWRRENLPEDPVPFLIGVARNVLRNAKRRQSRHPTQELLEQGSAPSAEDSALATLELREALLSLSDDDREILTLIAWEGLSTAQLSELYGLSANAIYVRVSRARAHLATALGKVDNAADMDRA
jgi:RNA polymerase sigma-70 factor, ECF subfamily